jgi:hypothetical protein
VDWHTVWDAIAPLLAELADNRVFGSKHGLVDFGTAFGRWRRA